MAKPPADQHCMFCDPDPCQCHTPKKKASTKKRSKPSSAQTVQAAGTADSTSSPTQPSVPPSGSSGSFDPKAAMKAAAENATPARQSNQGNSGVLDEGGHHFSDLSSRRLRANDLAKLGDARQSESDRPESRLTDANVANLDSEDRKAVFSLGPLLADRDKDACPSIFKDPTLRAERWKEQRRD